MSANPPTNNTRRIALLIITILIIVACLLLWLILRARRQPTNPPSAGVPPVAVINGSYTVDEATPFTLDGSGSTGDIASYTWDLGDGRSVTGATPSVSYDDGPADYTVTLVVHSPDGQTSTASTQVMVRNLPPVADAGGPYFCLPGETIQLAGTCSDPSPVDDGQLSCAWADFSGTTVSLPNYTCPDTMGEFTLTLTATDKDGASAQDSTTLTVTDELPTATPSSPIATPTATATPSSPIATPTPQPGENQPPTAVINFYLRSKNGLQFGFDGSQSSDPDGQIVSYSWDFGDGFTDTGAVVVHEFAALDANNPYTVTLVVTDDDGATGTATVRIP